MGVQYATARSIVDDSLNWIMVVPEEVHLYVFIGNDSLDEHLRKKVAEEQNPLTKDMLCDYISNSYTDLSDWSDSPGDVDETSAFLRKVFDEQVYGARPAEPGQEQGQVVVVGSTEPEVEEVPEEAVAAGDEIEEEQA